MDTDKNIQQKTNELLAETGGVEDGFGNTMVEAPSKQSDNTDTQPADTSEPKETKEVTEVKPEVQPETTEQVDETQDVGTKRNRARERFERLTGNNREMKAKLDQQQSVIDKLLSQRTEAPIGETLPADQAEAVTKLKSMLGLDGINNLVQTQKSEIDRLTKSHQDKAYDEEEGRLTKMIEKVGLEPDEKPDDILEDLDAHISRHPILGRMVTNGQIPPGVRELAFKDLFAEQLGKVGKRLAQKEEVEFREKQKKVNQEHSALPSKQSGLKLTGNVVRDADKLLKQAGGIDALEW